MEANNEAKTKQETTQSTTADASKCINLIVKTARVQKSIEIDENDSIKSLRQKAANAFEVSDPVLTVLIFGGKILKDYEDIKTHGIKDGQTIHLVIRTMPSNSDNPNLTNSSQRANQNTSSTNPITNNNSSAINNNNNIPNSNHNARQEFPSMNPLLGNLGDVQQRLQQMLISNPNTMQSMIEPLMQQMRSNPAMQSLFDSMQRMNSLMERNPEVNHLLSNPDVLRESLEMVRNPAALQEVMRNYDRALNNMESMPGGYNVLRRMYTEFQEPLLSAFQENTNQFSAQPDSGANNTDSNTTGSDTEQQRTENRDPLPNPWAPQGQQTQTANEQGARVPFNPMNLFAAATGANANTGSSDSGLGGGNLGVGLDEALSGGLSELQAALSGMSVPNLDGISNTSDLLQRAGTLFQDQEFISLLSDPEALQSVMQIQQGFERLRRIAPNLFHRLGLSYSLLPRTNFGITNTNNSNNNNNGNGNGNGSGGADDTNEKDKSRNPDDKQDRH